MKLVSWNVNGLRSAEERFLEFVDSEQPDILMLQEVRALPNDLTMFLQFIEGYQVRFNPSDRPGYSGTALYYKKSLDFDQLRHRVGCPLLDIEGRTILATLGSLAILNLYTPNGSSGETRLDFKLRYYAEVIDFVSKLQADKYHIILGGDLNVCPADIDLYDPVPNKNRSGLLPAERAWFTKLQQLGLVDTFRHFEPTGGHYTWWHMRDPERELNRGWRFDYFLVSQELLPQVTSARILRNVNGSDHCPILLELSL